MIPEFEIHIVKHVYHRIRADTVEEALDRAYRLECMHDDPARYEPDSWEYRVSTGDKDEDGVVIEEAMN